MVNAMYNCMTYLPEFKRIKNVYTIFAKRETKWVNDIIIILLFIDRSNLSVDHKNKEERDVQLYLLLFNMSGYKLHQSIYSERIED